MDARAVWTAFWCLVVLGGLVVGSTSAIVDATGAEGGEVVDPSRSSTDVATAGPGADAATADPSVDVATADPIVAPTVGSTPATTPDRVQEQAEASIEGYDEVHVEVALEGQNGSAAWTVQYRYRLDDENDTVDWDELRTDVQERPDAYVETFEERWSDRIEQARNETEREMELSNFEVRTENQSGVQEYGFVTFTFRWSSFARVDLNRIEAGDALEGFVLDDRTRLLIGWPERYNLSSGSVRPTPDDTRENAVIWEGDRTEFVEDEPRLELIRTDGESISEPEGEGGDSSLSWVAIGGVAALAIVGTAGWLFRRRREPNEAVVEETTPGDDPGDEPSEPPPELLSNEERVLRLLERNGGRIKQQEVVSELDWTEAKTSQVVSDLREAGDVEVFRIGRENVLTLPEEREE